MTTTIAAVRDRMVRLVRGLVPSIESSTRFDPFREQGDFRTWAEANPASALRRYSVRSYGEVSPPEVTNTDVEFVWDTIEVVVAYPVNGRFGEKAQTALDDVIAADLRLIEHTVGTNGYAVYAAQNPGATVLTTGTTREDGPAVTFGVLTLRAGIYREMS